VDKNYLARRRALSGSYSLLPESGDGCHYCGIPADTYDHVPSLSKVHALGLECFEKEGVRLWIVPACRECNSILSADNCDTVGERKKLIKKKLASRYSRYLKSAKWTPKELDELGYNLRQAIEQGADIKEWVRRRIDW
jgi:hypothetical protein